MNRLALSSKCELNHWRGPALDKSSTPFFSYGLCSWEKNPVGVECDLCQCVRAICDCALTVDSVPFSSFSFLGLFPEISVSKFCREHYKERINSFGDLAEIGIKLLSTKNPASGYNLNFRNSVQKQKFLLALNWKLLFFFLQFVVALSGPFLYQHSHSAQKSEFVPIFVVFSGDLDSRVFYGRAVVQVPPCS